MTGPLLELDRVTKRFGRVVIAEDLSLAVGQGRLLRSADANEFVAGNAEFNEYFITAEILTSSKPETSLI